jgi:ketosteroid isomerase-like protein
MSRQGATAREVASGGRWEGRNEEKFAWPQGKAATEGTEKAVAALEEKWLQAIKANNPDTLAPLLAAGFISTSAEGKVTGKAETLADAKTSHWESASYEAGVKVTPYGNTAIASGIFNGKGTDGKGKHLDQHEHWTDTWVKMPDGAWQCVASHGSPIKK